MESLRESALNEENAGFDPSGTSQIEDGVRSDGSRYSESYAASRSESSSRETDHTELTKAFAPIDESDPALQVHHESIPEWQGMSSNERKAILAEMFPSVKAIDMAYILEKCANDGDRAVEQLLNQVFLEVDIDDRGEKTFKRGVDGFADPAGIISGKKRGKNRRQRRLSPTPSRPGISAGNESQSNQWNRAIKDLDFIQSRVHLPETTVTTMYYKSGRSLGKTIANLGKASEHENPYLAQAPASLLSSHAGVLKAEFKNLSHTQALSLTRMTYPSIAPARDLARELAYHSAVSDSIIPSYRPRTPSPPPTLVSHGPAKMAFPSHTVERLHATRAHAYGQTSSAHRAAKSRPLMGGAAAYYGSVAREATAALHEQAAADAESLVSSQSRPGEVDLHGVSAQHAVSIAKRRVEQWWEREGREWAREGKVRDGGLVFITGKGQHSQGGKGKLGPAVGAMLVREGWKVEVGSGAIEVVGRARK